MVVQPYVTPLDSAILISSSVDTIDDSIEWTSQISFRDIQLMLFHIRGIYPTNFEFLSNK